MEPLHFFGQKFIIIMLMTLVGCSTSKSQKGSAGGAPLSSVKEMIDARQIVFTAQYAQPMGGRSIYLTTRYDLRINSDTISADLPYFGRAYNAPMNITDAGIRFTTSHMKISILQKKKNQWIITLLPDDNLSADVREMMLTVFSNGKASLQVNSNNRQPISFTGSVEAPAN